MTKNLNKNNQDQPNATAEEEVRPQLTEQELKDVSKAKESTKLFVEDTNKVADYYWKYVTSQTIEPFLVQDFLNELTNMYYDDLIMISAEQAQLVFLSQTLFSNYLITQEEWRQVFQIIHLMDTAAKNSPKEEPTAFLQKTSAKITSSTKKGKKISKK